MESELGNVAICHIVADEGVGVGESVKVLVVDDDRRMVKTICDILKTEGLETAPAFTGEDAVEIVKAEGPDCVLMDIKMPGIDGLQALRMMKQLDPIFLWY